MIMGLGPNWVSSKSTCQSPCPQEPPNETQTPHWSADRPTIYLVSLYIKKCSTDPTHMVKSYRICPFRSGLSHRTPCPQVPSGTRQGRNILLLKNESYPTMQDGPQFVHAFTCFWTFKLLPPFGCCGQCCFMNWCSNSKYLISWSVARNFIFDSFRRSTSPPPKHPG